MIGEKKKIPSDYFGKSFCFDLRKVSPSNLQDKLYADVVKFNFLVSQQHIILIELNNYKATN